MGFCVLDGLMKYQLNVSELKNCIVKKKEFCRLECENVHIAQNIFGDFGEEFAQGA